MTASSELFRPGAPSTDLSELTLVACPPIPLLQPARKLRFLAAEQQSCQAQNQAMAIDLNALLPVDKMDTDRAAELVAVGFPGVQPVLANIMEWVRDANWPVAQVFLPFLASIGSPLAPLVRPVLASGDDLWKYWLLSGVVAQSSDLAHALAPELRRLSASPTAGELAEGVFEAACDILRGLS